MGTIFEVSEDFDTVDLKGQVKIIVRSLSLDMIALNKQQLLHGLSDLGTKIDPGYKNAKYADDKYGQNPLAGYGNPDLFRTGKFYASFYIRFTEDGWESGSTDDKAAKLEKKYNENGGIFGLDDESIQELADKIGPDIQEYISKKTGAEYTS